MASWAAELRRCDRSELNNDRIRVKRSGTINRALDALATLGRLSRLKARYLKRRGLKYDETAGHFASI